MYDIVEYSDINNNYILIDLRTKEEYNDFHIPGAYNIPILEYDERKEVGTLYDNGKKDLAKSKALEFGSKKLKILHEYVINHKDKKIVFYCARGGFRSKTVSSLFFSLGYQVYQLKGGIKAYRNYVNNNLSHLISKISLITLYGPTGSGKTDILHILKDKFPTIDLESLANHKGSALGSIGIGNPNSQKMFEALLFEYLSSSDDKLFLIEGESKRIGKIVLPEELWQKIQNSKKLYIDSPIDKRVNRLINSYVIDNNTDELIDAINSIEKYISKENFNTIKKSIEDKDFYSAAKILCEKYYDHNYKFKPDESSKIFVNIDDKICAKEIYEYIKN